MKYTTLFFDLDGTITNPEQGITTAVAYALDYYGKPYESKEQLRCFIGPPLREQFMKFCGLDREAGDEYVAKYREYYSVKGIYENEVYKGIPEMLEKLKRQGKKIVLATSKPEKFAKLILDHFDLTKYFDFVAGSLMDNSRTVKSEVLEFALKSVGNPDVNATLMIGDRLHDVEGAAKCGIKTVGVTFGFGTRQELEQAGAYKIADSVDELYAVLSE